MPKKIEILVIHASTVIRNVVGFINKKYKGLFFRNSQLGVSIYFKD